MKTIYFVFFIFFLFSTFTYATIINVPADQPTIQAGIYSAAVDDTVLVQPGIYNESAIVFNRNIVVGSLYLTTADTSYISSTIINSSSSTVVVFTGNVDSTAILNGFTITGANSSIGFGGGIRCVGSSPTISYNIIRDNTVSAASCCWGGGLYLENSDAKIIYNQILNNTATYSTTQGYGGGIYSQNSDPLIANNIISNNSSDIDGGGIYFLNSQVRLFNNIISGNNSQDGGGIYCDGNSTGIISDNTIFADSASWSGGGIYLTGNSNIEISNNVIHSNWCAFSGGGLYCSASYPTIINNNTFCYNEGENGLAALHYLSTDTIYNNIFFGNIGDYVLSGNYLEYCDIYGNSGDIFMWSPAPGTGELTTVNSNGDSCDVYYNILMDPLFVDPGNGDFHLTEDSPCIDAGGPAFAYDPDGTITDMGAYYFYQPPDANFAADITNGYTPLTVNFTDLSTGVIDEWYWDFGDGDNSTLQDPSNEYYNRGSYTVSLTVSDVNDSTDAETKVDYIMVLNTAPIVQNPIMDFSFDEDTSNSSIDLNNVFDDADLPYGDILSFSYSGNTFINVGIVSGIVTLTPDPDWFGFEDITFTAIDDSLVSISDEVRITIDPVNDAPVINSYDPSYSPVTIDENESQLFWVSASDIDGDLLSCQWYVDEVPQTGQTDSTYTHSTNYTSAGTYMIKCIVDDGAAERTFGFSRFSRVDKANRINLEMEDNRATDYQEWQLIVIDVDQNIIVNDIQPAPGTVTIDEMDTINFLINAYDPDGNPLEYSWKLDGVEESTISTYDFITDYNSAGNYLVTLDVTDNFSDNSIYYEWNVTVNDVDQNIVVNDIQPPPGPVTIDEMETIDFFFSGNDPDGNPLDYSWELDEIEVSIDSTYTFETDYTSAGEYVVTLEVTDNFGTRRISGSPSRDALNYSWDVTVNDVDQAIVVNELIPPEGNIIIDEGDVINFSIDAYDPDGNDLEYSWQVEGEEVSEVNAFDFITDENSAGEYEVTLFVTDNFSTRNELDFLWNVTVNDVDQPIVVNEIIPPEGNIIIDEGDIINFSIDAYDPDGNDLEYSWQVDGVEESVESTFDFVTDENSAGEYEVTLFVTDDFSTRDELNFLWNVTVNDVSGSEGVLIPVFTKLYQNHPNPFNPETNMKFDIKDNETGVLTIFNMKGQIVESQNFNSGRHNYLWNTQNCSSGVYFYKLQTETIIETRKMLLLK